MSDSPVRSSPSPSPVPSSRRSGGRRQGISSSSTSAAELAEYRALIPRSEGSLYASEGKLHTERLVVTKLRRRTHDADEEASQDEAAPPITHPTQRLKEQKLRELASPKSLLRSLESVSQARWPTAEATHEWNLADEVEGILLRHAREEEERIQGGLDEPQQRRIASTSPQIGEAGPSRLSAESPPPRPDEGSSDEASKRSSSSSQAQRRIKHSSTHSLSRSPSPTPFLLPSIALAQRTLSQLFDALRTMDEAAADRRKVQIEWKDVLAALRLMHVDEEVIERVRRRCEAIFEPEEEEEEEEGEEEVAQAQAQQQPDLLDTSIYRALSTSTTSSLAPKRSHTSTDALLLAYPLHLPALPGTHAHSHTLWSADSLLAAPAARQLAPPPLGRKARKEAGLMSEMAGKAHEGVRRRWEVELGRRRGRREEKGKGKEIEKEVDLGDDAVGKQNEEQEPAGMDVDDDRVAASVESSAQRAPASPSASSRLPANNPTAQQQASSSSSLARRPSPPQEEQRPSKRRRKGKVKNRSSDGVEPTSEGASGSGGIMPPRERSVKSSDEASSSRGTLVAAGAPGMQHVSEAPAFVTPGPSNLAAPSHLAGPSAPPAPKAASAQSSLPIPLAYAAPSPPEAAAAASRKKKKDKDKSKASTSGSSFAALQKGKKRQHGF